MNSINESKEQKIKKIIHHFASLGIYAKQSHENPSVLELENISTVNKKYVESGKANEFCQKKYWLGYNKIQGQRNAQQPPSMHWDESYLTGEYCNIENGKVVVNTDKCCNHKKINIDKITNQTTKETYNELIDEFPSGFAFQKVEDIKKITNDELAIKKYKVLEEQINEICTPEKINAIKSKLLEINKNLTDKGQNIPFDTSEKALNALNKSEIINNFMGLPNYLMHLPTKESTAVMDSVFNALYVNEKPIEVSNNDFNKNYQTLVLIRGFLNKAETQELRKQKTEEIIKWIKDGNTLLAPSKGSHGTGEYFSALSNPDTAYRFGSKQTQNMMVARLSPTAKTVDVKQLEHMSPYIFDKAMEAAKNDKEAKQMQMVVDLLQNAKFPSFKHQHNFPMKSAIALLCGYDVLTNDINHPYCIDGKTAPTENEFIAINKSALIIPEKAVLSEKENEAIATQMYNNINIQNTNKDYQK